MFDKKSFQKNEEITNKMATIANVSKVEISLSSVISLSNYTKNIENIVFELYSNLVEAIDSRNEKCVVICEI